MNRAQIAELEAATGCSIAPAARAGLHQVSCPSHSAKVRMLDLKAWKDARYDARVRRLAVGIARGLGRDVSPRALAPAIHRAVQSRVRYLGEGIETFQDAFDTWETGLGDCDDHTILVLALARAVGLKARVETMPDAAGIPRHAVAMLDDGSGFRWAETTIAARWREHPSAALRRLKGAGALAAGARDDIGAAADLGELGDELEGDVLALGSVDAWARAVLLEAWGDVRNAPPPTLRAVQAVQAVGRFEGFYGLSTRPPEWAGHNNWAASQKGLEGPNGCPPASFPTGDTNPDGTKYRACFHHWDTPREGAASLLGILVRMPKVRAVLGNGSADDMAAAMFASGYFTGVCRKDDPGGMQCPPAPRIGRYADAIANNAKSIAAKLNERHAVTRDSGVLSLAVGALLIGGAGYGAWRYWPRKRKGARR